MKVIVNGLPGKVATLVAQYLEHNQTGFEFHPYSMTGPSREISDFMLDDLPVKLIPSRFKDANLDHLLDANIAVDYTHPSAVHDNIDFYCEHEMPFVMGTTGGDRDALNQRVRDSQTVAVIAPNMAPRVVAMQAMIAYGAQQFPGLFAGYDLTVDESHQKGKADTSGTAKANVSSFNKMGINFTNDKINKERRVNEQLAMGVPAEYLGGHGWHEYKLTSPDGSEEYGFMHNINGRQTYVDGTILALNFLKQKIDTGEKGKVYSMIDVLRGA